MKRLLILFLAMLLLAGCSTLTKQEQIDEHLTDDTNDIIDEPNINVNTMPKKYLVDQYQNYSSSISIDDINNQTNMQSTFSSYDITINNTGNDIDATKFLQRGLFLEPNKIYKIKMDIESNVAKDIIIRVIDNDNSKTLYEHYYTINGKTPIEFSFNSYSEMSFSTRIEISIGGQDLANVNIRIANISLELPYNKFSVKVNQVGYQLYKQKIAVFSNYDGDYFTIYDSNTNIPVYTGAIVNKVNDINSREMVGYGNFSDFDEVGQYYIVAQNGSKSYPFEISEKIYDDTLLSVFKMISSQRCGYELTEALYHQLAHPQCHNNWALAYGFEHEVNAQGGWHDAGDYGRYVSTTAKTTIDLMMTYLVAGDKFDDQMTIVESGNGINDLLDEIKVGINFLLNIQRGDGGVYHKIVTKDFASFVSPEDDNNEIYAMNVDTASTAFSTALFAIANKMYIGIDDDFANRCYDAAMLGYQFMQNNDYIEAYDPPEFGSGNYHDEESGTEKFLMNIALWYMTDDLQYADIAANLRKSIENFSLNVEYNNPSLYGAFLFALYGPDSALKKEYTQSVIDYANNFYDATIDDAYLISLGQNFTWGSNAKVANRAMVMLMGYQLNGDYKYVEAAYNQIHYLLGRNATNYSFVTGNGDKYPQNIHHRFTVANNVQLDGALVGGPNSYREDGLNTPSYNKDTAPSKSYIDHKDSFATNEVAIYYNSPLVYVLANLE